MSELPLGTLIIQRRVHGLKVPHVWQAYIDSKQKLPVQRVVTWEPRLRYVCHTDIEVAI